MELSEHYVVQLKYDNMHISLQNDLISSCVEYHEMLHEDFINFSHLAQVKSFWGGFIFSWEWLFVFI